MYSVIAKNSKGKYGIVSMKPLSIKEAREMRDNVDAENDPLIVNEVTVDKAIALNNK